MSFNKIYRYWEGHEPDYIKMCKESLYKHCKNFEIIEYGDYENPYNLSINHKTDLLKTELVYKNGGFWIDADMIVMKDLSPLIKLFDKTDFIGMPAFFGAREGAPIMRDWYNEAREKAKHNPTFSDLIFPLLHHPCYKPYKYLTHEMITPIWHTAEEVKKFFLDEKTEGYITENTYIITLYNSLFPKEFLEMSREEIFKKDWLISKMFKKALCE